jgi:protoporphyrinogen oxidase
VSARGRSHPGRVVVIGAGPAGLTAAYTLARQGVPVHVLEADAVVGGLSRTVEHKGYRFDIGGHRFFTKVRAVRALWDAMLGDELVERPRLSRIYYDGRFFDYPLKPVNALAGLGLARTAVIVASYLHSRWRPIRPEVSFEDWTVNRFGRRLYEIFFKAYTEKVWGLPCNRIEAQWAAQRIKDLSLSSAIRDILLRPLRREQTQIRTLIDRFRYPRLGPGMMWEAFHRAVEQLGASVALDTRVRRVLHEGGRVSAVEFAAGGDVTRVEVDAVVSTMPLRELVHALSPAPPSHVVAAANRLQYRDFLTVALIVDVAELFPDNWIYVHDPHVRLVRFQNFKNWSPAMVPDSRTTCLGLEYFCQQGDDLWSMSDRELIAFATRELSAIGLLERARVIDGTVVRVPKAYPVYDRGYRDALVPLRAYFGTFENLQLAGRNGLHKYNNQDHAMVTGILAARALLGHRADPWLVNVEDEYHEAGDEFEGLVDDVPSLMATQPLVPAPLARPGVGV